MTGAAEPWWLPVRLPGLRAALRPAAMTLSVVVIALLIEAAARLPYGEIRSLAFGSLAFGTRQRRANQRPMHRTIVFDEDRIRFGFRIGTDRRDIFEDGFRRRFGRGGRECRTGCSGVHEIRENQLTGLFPTRRRHLGLLVFVVRVAGRAARLPDLIFDHGNDRMVRDAALARTVIVENVTEPKPALLHDSPGPIPFNWDG
jgi:hypothetical protein